MCGIIGIVGGEEAAPKMMEALKRLEYRGYDSAGVATLVDGKLDRRRAVGKLAALSEELAANPIQGTVGIGHTRWATHGAPTVANAHPHATDRAMVVHNGIIENFKELRTELEEHGYSFQTETDTETVVALLTYYLEQGISPFDAADATLKRLKGAFALCMLFRNTDDLIICARRGSPLAIGYGDRSMYIGSDALALAPFTNRICYLEEGDWASVTRNGAQIFDEEGRLANRQVAEIPVTACLVDKGEYKHFMAKEIHEQPVVMENLLSAYISADHQRFVAPVEDLDFTSLSRLSIVACGTAHYAGAVSKYWFEQLAKFPCDVDVASEFRYRQPPLDPNGAALFVSQSGETADTLAALRHCREAEQRILSVVNVPTSTIARESDAPLPTLAGPEIGVASTKAFTCQLTVLASLAAIVARQRGVIDAAEEAKMAGEMLKLPALMRDALKLESTIASAAADLSKYHDVLYLGRGAMFPLALEGALKLKEISYMHAEGYASGELKHGPIALISEEVPVVVLAPRDELFDKTVSNMQEVMARGGRIILISDEAGVAEAGEGAWKTITMPEVDPMLAPILYTIPVQLLAYHGAVVKGTDVDQPRNLAKSVTVE
ncbi:MAG: glutamine--fructose-6-phosphate transaminase (isomerizing) [Neomegalonema sp.]|nr:glutamine--fructose-6-phosphate transaminase (isomerizing) [Neomegalonema sp.]